MDVNASLTTPHERAALYAVVADLGTYPMWLDIVSRVDVDPPDAWNVDLRARIGPLARSKRLRMVRTVAHHNEQVQFSREEVDGRSHSAWILDATITEGDDGQSNLNMHLHYGGRLWLPVLERLLQDEIVRSRQRLIALLDADGSSPLPG